MGARTKAHRVGQSHGWVHEDIQSMPNKGTPPTRGHH